MPFQRRTEHPPRMPILNDVSGTAIKAMDLPHDFPEDNTQSIGR